MLKTDVLILLAPALFVVFLVEKKKTASAILRTIAMIITVIKVEPRSFFREFMMSH
jgi:hypothetical protein